MTRTRGLLLGGLLLALLLAGVVSQFASGSPDGLEKVAEDKGFIATATDSDLADSPVADYAVRGVDDERVSGGLAGVLGVLATFAIGGALFLVVRRGAGPAGREDRAGGEPTPR
ncbi:MAG: hypothetical protein AVDCRST_MAG41-1186 [uncultured Corynebacteriales bacterium]|uniref:PDGLE domain-containing protein n=1 Tax=uncultured Mycobacteriales bacterium TaxID=581187 RepID=A0A6J4HZP5_9ACTN|nr:MAG: hypothetical protein AVDCRST_MAG41-1186 [uncultured Corynebacteriales bacterium]